MKIKNKIILVFSFISFFSIRASHFSPNNEIKTIQTLPKNPGGATLDIEVTKVKTEKINGFIDEENKKIKIDFSDKKNKKAKELVSEEKKYDIFVFDNPNDISFFSSSGKNDRRSVLNLPKLYDYKVDEKNSDAISIDYEDKPETLYIGVRDRSSNEVIKIYNTEITPYEISQIIISNGLVINNPVLLSTPSITYAYPFKKNSGAVIKPEIIKSGDLKDGTQPGTKYSASERTISTASPISAYGMIENANWTLGNNLTVSGYPLSNFEGITVTRVDRISTSPARLRFYNGSTEVTNSVSYKKWNRSTNADVSAFLIQGDKPVRHLLFGINSWNLSQQSAYTQFTAPLSPPSSIGSYQRTHITIPPFDPEAYYDNINSTIKIDRSITSDGTKNLEMSNFWNSQTSLNANYSHPGSGHTGDHIQKTDVKSKTIELGTIKIFNSTEVPQIASDHLGKPLKFHAPTSKITLSDGSGNTITGNIYIEGNLSEITAESARTAKKVYLELDELKNGTFTTADNTEILRLGLLTDNILDDIISKVTVTIPTSVQVVNALNLSNPVALTSGSSEILTSDEGVYPLNISGSFGVRNYNGNNLSLGASANQGYISGGTLGAYGLIENSNWITGQINVAGKVNSTNIVFQPPQYVTGMAVANREQDPSLTRSYIRFRGTIDSNTIDPPPEKKWAPTSIPSGVFPFLSESGSGTSSYLSFSFSRWNYGLNRVLLTYTLGADSNSYQQTYINIPPFEPEAYYDNVNSTLKIDGSSQNIDTMNFWSSTSATEPSYGHNVNGRTSHTGAEITIEEKDITGPMIELGTIRARNDINFYASDSQGDILKFYTSGADIELIDSNNSTNKIRGRIIIKLNTAEYNEYNAKDLKTQSATVYLNLLETAKTGDFVIAADATKNILRLGIKSMFGEIYDDIISRITIKISAPTPFLVENSILIANPFAVSDSASKAYPMNGTGNFYAESSPGGNSLTLSPAKGVLGAGYRMGSYGLLEDAKWKNGEVTVTGDVSGSSLSFSPSDFGSGITKIERIQDSGLNSSYLAFKNSSGTEIDPAAASKTAGIINFFLTQYSNPSKHLNIGFGAGNTWNGSQKKITLSIKNAFNQEQKTYVHVPPLDPEAFYDNEGATIKIDNTEGAIDTLNFWTNTDDLQNPTYTHTHSGAQITRSDEIPGDFSADGININLGTIKSKDISAPYAQNFTLEYFTSSTGITLTESGTGKKITGRILIEDTNGFLYSPPFELTRAIIPRKVYLQLDKSTLKNGTFTAGNDQNILGLGKGSTFDRIIGTLTVKLTKIPNPAVKVESAIVINNPVALAKNVNITYPFKNNEGNGTRIEPRIINSSGVSTDNIYMYSATRRGSNIGNYGLVNNTDWITESINISGFNPSDINITDIKRVADATNTNLEFYNGTALQNISGKKWQGNTSSGMSEFLIEGTTNGNHLTMGFDNWDLKQKTFEFIYSSKNGTYPTDGSIGYIYITLPPFDPEAYYDNSSSTIKMDGQSGDIDTTNFWSSSIDLKPTYTNHSHSGASIKRNFVIDKKVNLGTIKILDEMFVPDIASDLLGKPLKFYTADSITLVDVNNPTNKIIGKIYIENAPGNKVSEIDAKDTREAKNVYLELDTLKKGNFTVENAEILKLGIPTDGIFDDVISKIELQILVNSSFIIDYEPKILDFGKVIEGQFNANEAKTRISITYDSDLIIPSFRYELQRDDGSQGDYYNDFKLYQNGDKNSQNFAVADLWLGIESIPNSNETHKRTNDLNGKLKSIDNAPTLGGVGTIYKNIVNIVVTLEEAP